MSLQGKGFFIWKVRDCEGGDAQAIANLAKASGYTHIAVKVADGPYAYNINTTTGADLAAPVVQALRARGIRAWGWHYVYGSNPVGEANIAIQRIQALGLEGYIIDAEAEFKQPGRETAARTLMSRLRNTFPQFPLALTSYRFPSYHPQFPWKAFLEYCDFNMPQVYWEQAHNPDAQLRRCVSEFQALTPFRPIIPIGPAYKTGGWAPTPTDIVTFLDTARALNLSAASFFSWDECRRDLPQVWNAIASYSWAVQPPQPDISQQYIEALNSGNPEQVVSLYHNDAVHVTAARTIQGTEALRAWYITLLRQILPGARFTLTGFSGSGNTRHFNWTAQSSQGTVRDGSDTLGTIAGKIAYHYTSFTISR
jgi:hypothetical protein